MHACMSARVDVYTYIIYIYICICMYVCMCICVLYTHTHFYSDPASPTKLACSTMNPQKPKADPEDPKP